jgi:hypothetical protein
MDTIALLREQVKDTHELLESTLGEMTGDQAHWNPGGKANPAGSTYAHIVFSEDGFFNMILGRPVLGMTSFAGKTGLSEPPPMGGDSEQWFKNVKIDMPALRSYGQAVFKNTDEYIASLKPEDLQRELDLSNIGLGKRSLGWLISTLGVIHPSTHAGEISCLKGLQGTKGYPF